MKIVSLLETSGLIIIDNVFGMEVAKKNEHNKLLKLLKTLTNLSLTIK